MTPIQTAAYQLGANAMRSAVMTLIEDQIQTIDSIAIRAMEQGADPLAESLANRSIALEAVMTLIGSMATPILDDVA